MIEIVDEKYNIRPLILRHDFYKNVLIIFESIVYFFQMKITWVAIR